MIPLETHPARRSRRDGWTPERRAKFLDCLATTANVKLACAVTGLSRQSAYRLQARDPAFAAAWNQALRMARETAAEAFLASLSESLLRTMSDLSGSCHLAPAGNAAGKVPETSPRTLSHSSMPCHLRS